MRATTGGATLIGTGIVCCIASAKPAVPVLATQLSRAAERDDEVQLVRLAQRMGVTGMRRLLRTRDVRRLRAAIAAAPFTPASWHLLGPLVALMHSRQPALARGAAAAVQQIVADLRPATLVHHEDHPHAIADAARILLATARRTRSSPATRAAALRALGFTLRLGHPDWHAVVPLLSASPEIVQRAAFTALAHAPSPEAEEHLAQVASTAAGNRKRWALLALCGGQTHDPRRRPAKPVHPALANSATLDLLLDVKWRGAASPDERDGLASCLLALVRRTGGADRRRAVRALRGLRSR